MSLEPGSSLGRFRIVRMLGAGGMGEVYAARDEKLGREVAVKVLPGELGAHPERIARLEREARLLAKLSHPNILVIHELGEERGRRFVVTELLEGTTVRQRLRRGPLPWRRAVEIAAAVAEGLAAAHESGVVHRDIKPENVFITTGGQVKILDFGLARLEPRRPAPGESILPTISLPAGLTRSGAVVGTLGYMSPEQVLGQPAGHRADIFAVGCLLYEMVTGRPAFRRASPAETARAILDEEPEELTAASGQLPAELAQIVARCLQKRPERRFQSASDLAFALRSTLSSAGPEAPPPARRFARLRWPVAAVLAILLVGLGTLAVFHPWARKKGHPPPKQVRVAILGFEDRTGDPTLASLGPMLAHGILRGAEVLSGTSIVAAPRAGDDPAAAARSVDARYVIDGAYYLVGDTIRADARLLDVRDGSVVYASPPVTAPRNDPPAVIEPLRQRMLGAVGWYLGSQSAHGLSRASADLHPPTLAALLEWRRGWERFAVDYPTAAQYFQRAIKLSPGFFTGRVALFFSYSNPGRCQAAHEVLEAARHAKGPLTPTEELLLEWMQAVDGRQRTGELRVVRQLDRAMPDLGSFVFAHGDAALSANHPAEAARVLERALALLALDSVRPTSWWRPNELAEAYHMNGDYERSLDVVERTRGKWPGVLQLEAMRAANLAALGRLEDLRTVVREAQTVNATSGTPGWVLLTAAEELAAHGHPGEARSMAERAAAWYRSTAAGERRSLRPKLIRALLLEGRTGEARAVAEEVIQVGSQGLAELRAAGVAFARAGERRRAREILERIARLHDPCGPQEATYARAAIEAQLGNKKTALALLRKALAQGYFYSIELHRDPDLAPLWHEPEFIELLRPKG